MSFILEQMRWTMAVALSVPLYVASAAEIVLHTGVASPQSESEIGNVEVLRERAIRNAINLAVLQVSGATVSGERGGSMVSEKDQCYLSEI